jgi:hypothetical protein
MKRWLPIGLLAGAVLLTVVWRNARRPHVLVVPREARTSVVRPSLALRRKPPSPPSANSNAAPRSLWAAVESRDPVRLVANLRELGCPEQTIRDLMTFRLCRDYREHLLDLETESARSWDYTRMRSDLSKLRQQQDELRNALDRDLETLLGVSAAKLKASVFGQRESIGESEFLSLAKRAQVRDLNLRYRRLTEEARQGLPLWEPDATVDANVAEVDRQKQAELATLLTPQELEAFKLHESPAARYVLKYLPEAKSEAEFRKMVQAVEDVGIKAPRMAIPILDFPGMPDRSNEDRKQAQMQARLEARLKELLGEQRLAELEQGEQARLAEERRQSQAR